MSSGRILVAAALLALGPGVAALGQALPPDQAVEYRIREVPGDPNSPVVWTITLELTAIERHDALVRWHVRRADVRACDPVNGDTVWRVADPAVDTPSGDWWVEHIKAEEPAAEDFMDLPHTGGLAADLAQVEDDLEFSCAGAASPGGAALLTYSFRVSSESEPRKSGEDEEIDPPVPTPLGEPLECAASPAARSRP